MPVHAPQRPPLTQLEGLEHVHLGAAPGCYDCDLEDLGHHDDPERYADAESTTFSKSPCDGCRNPDHGKRHHAHARDAETDELLHLDLCEDCFDALAFG
jgi:hypothetical protein